MADEAKGLLHNLWRSALTFLAATLAIWLGVHLLLAVWKVLAVLAALAGAIALAVWWWRRRYW